MELYRIAYSPVQGVFVRHKSAGHRAVLFYQLQIMINGCLFDGDGRNAGICFDSRAVRHLAVELYAVPRSGRCDTFFCVWEV